jgi:hypothetical protein
MSTPTKSSVPTVVPNAPRKKPQWLLDEEAADPTLAGKLDAARAEAAKVAAEKAARDAERATACAAWHAARPKWVMQLVQVTPGVRGNEREWEVPPKTAERRVRNNAKCPHCGK